MNGMKKFESLIGGRWTGVIFHKDPSPYFKQPDRPMRFCEAIKESSTSPITLTKKDMNCSGALRSFGWGYTENEELTRIINQYTGINEKTALSVVQNVPHLNAGDPIAAITVGSYESPDIFISYAQPEAAMRLLFQWQQISGSILEVAISSVMGICGCVAAGAYLSNEICLSFGCPESREHGSIGNDRLAIGLPADLVEKFLNSTAVA